MKVMWAQLPSSGNSAPGGRSSHSCNVIKRKLYVFGGERTPRVPVDNTIFCFDLDNNAWLTLECKGESPCARIAHGSAVVDEKLFIFGGRTGIEMGEGSLNDLYCFDPVALTWSEVKTQGQVPSERSYHAMATRGSQMFVFGGCGTEGRLNDLYCCETTTYQWTQLPSYSPIRGRGGPGFVATEKTLFVVSGFAGEETNDMYQFDLESQTWTTLTPEPVFSPRSVFGIGRLGNNLVMFGGEVQPSDLGHAGAGGFTNETWVYNTNTKECKWIKVEAENDVTPPERGWFSAASAVPSSGKPEMVIFGGNAPDNSRLSDLWKLQLKN